MASAFVWFSTDAFQDESRGRGSCREIPPGGGGHLACEDTSSEKEECVLQVSLYVMHFCVWRTVVVAQCLHCEGGLCTVYEEYTGRGIE